MIYTILQPAGLGDIFFTQKIAHHFINLGYEIYWPVITPYSFISKYIKHPKIHFTTPPPGKHNYINLETAGNFHKNVSFMDAKYKLIGLDFSDWSNYFNFERYRSEEVMCNIPKYNLICDTFASPPYEQKINIVPNNDLINMYITKTCSPFDWCWMIEHATNLFFVDTCFTYIVEKLQLKENVGLYLYSRNFNKNESPTFLNTKHLFKKPWKLIHKPEDL